MSYHTRRCRWKWGGFLRSTLCTERGKHHQLSATRVTDTSGGRSSTHSWGKCSKQNKSLGPVGLDDFKTGANSLGWSQDRGWSGMYYPKWCLQVSLWSPCKAEERLRYLYPLGMKPVFYRENVNVWSFCIPPFSVFTYRNISPDVNSQPQIMRAFSNWCWPVSFVSLLSIDPAPTQEALGPGLAEKGLRKDCF